MMPFSISSATSESIDRSAVISGAPIFGFPLEEPFAFFFFAFFILVLTYFVFRSLHLACRSSSYSTRIFSSTSRCSSLWTSANFSDSINSIYGCSCALFVSLTNFHSLSYSSMAVSRLTMWTTFKFDYSYGHSTKKIITLSYHTNWWAQLSEIPPFFYYRFIRFIFFILRGFDIFL